MGSSQRGSESDTRSLSKAVIEAIADREGVDVTEIEPPRYEPLYTVVDPEALDTLFAPTFAGKARGSGSISFQYAGYDVVVEADGQVSLSKRATSAE